MIAKGAYVASTACLSPYGAGVAPMWNGMMSGRSALSSPPWAPGAGTVVGRIEDVPHTRSTRSEELAVIVARMIAAQVPLSGVVGLVVGTNGGALDENDDGDEPARIADELGLRGPVAGVRSDCASGIASLELAQAWLELRACDSVLVVGSSAYADKASVELLATSGALGSRAAGLPAPFGHQRQGTAASEGAAALLLKREPSSGSERLVLGTGLTLNSHRLVAPPTDCAALTRAITGAIEASDIDANMIAGIIAHGTGTELNERVEAQAIREAFGSRARSVPITSIKRWVGHTFASSGLFSVIAALEALEAGALPGCGTATLDAEFEDLAIARSSVALARGRCMLVLAHGMGVINGAVVLADAPDRGARTATQ